MKILVICQYYYPEPFKIHEICEELVKRDHEVTVVTGQPNYPDGDLIAGYEDGKRMDEIINGVHIIRTPITLRGHNSFSLVRNYFSYPYHAKKKLKELKEEFDVVFVYQLSPVFMISSAVYYKKKYKKKIYVYCLDLWPESLKVLNIKESNLVFKLIKKNCNHLYKQCDFISVTSPAFIDYLWNVNGVKENRINFIPQHGENLFLRTKPYKKQDKLNITFAGNIGKAQDFDCLIKAVRNLPYSYRNKLAITIIGSGSYESIFKEQVRKYNLDNIFDFTGRKTTDELIPYYENSSLFLLCLEKNSSISKTIPSKLQTYMSAGRGIIGSIDGTAAEIINEANAGKVCNAGDDCSLTEIIIEMINADEEFIREYAVNSRDYFLEHFTLDRYIDEITHKLENLR